MASLLFGACGEKTPEQNKKDTANVTVSPSSLVMDAEGDVAEVTITTDCSWTAESDVSWLDISIKKGGASKSGAVVEVSALPNPGEERHGKITVTGKNGSAQAVAEIPVTQPEFKIDTGASNILTLSVSRLSVPIKGTNQIIKLTATSDWQATSNVSWITVTPSSGKSSLKEQDVTISVAENDSGDRSGKVTFSIPDKTLELTVTQNGKADAKDITVADFCKETAETGIWYRITGTITQICDNSKDAYGNFYIKDDTGEVFVYGLTTEKSGTNDQSFSRLGLNEGDILTMITLRSEYHGKPQAGGSTPAYYESHEKGTQPVRTYSDFKATKATANWMELPETSEEDGHDLLHHTMWLGSREVRSYSMYWDYSNMVSRWVAYPLNRELMGYGKRTDKWGLDPLLPRDKQPVVTGAYSADADGVTYGRGHQIGSADRTNYEANSRTFFGTNMTPQISDFNGAIWANLENTVRLWSKRSTTDTLYVVTGCVVDDSTKSVTDVDGKRVTVPTGYYKALLRLYEGSYNAVGFYFDHKKYPVNKVDKSMAISIDALEELVGENFFVNLPDNIEAAVEAADPAKDNWWWDNMGE